MSELDRPEDDAADRLRAVRDRFMRRGPAKYRVLDDEWWQR